jgi:hypothetical protein
MIDHPSAARDAAVRAHFIDQATACDTLGSPFTGRLCRVLSKNLDRNTSTGQRVLNWPGDARADALALRLCGALHALVLSGADRTLAAIYPPNDADGESLAEVVSGAIDRNDERLVRALESAPQTNEIGRSGMLLPGFLTIARETGLPFAVNEIGSSAGLNLLFDRFHYRYGDVQWSDGDSPVQLRPEVRGAVPFLDGSVEVLSRSGCDIQPIDVSNDADRLRLRSFVWADQDVRLARLDAAIALAASVPFALEKSDAVEFVARSLARRQPGSVFVLYHSIMWQYMPQASKAAIEAALVEAGNAASPDSPVAWLRMEPLDTLDPHATLSLTLWPGGKTRQLAKCDFHGRWIEWAAPHSMSPESV